ncbi:UvrD-helicase domain-containing protein [Xanthomonas albilineans]|uniref:UvrD-helicase domain-containing protein n=1 Tax=Xanthomonas albilineans TaxID=29447 RepID=UPI0027D980C4|nr:UvrD-helicase domain-containing protein [Xanthomonas albilineans]
MEVKNHGERSAALPTVTVRESWRDVWFCFRKPVVLEISAKAMTMEGQDLLYWQLSAVQERAPTWFLPRWLDRGHLVLTYRSGTEECHWSFVLPSDIRAQAHKATLQRAHRELARALDAADQALVPLRIDAEGTYRSDRYVRHSQAERITLNHSETIRKMVPVLAALHQHPLLPRSNMEQARSLKEELDSLARFVLEPEASRGEHNERYLAHQCLSEAAYFNAVESSPLTAEQIAAALVFEDATLVVAAAGSGKSSCIVGKIGFALKSGMFKDHEILALAYNKEAAKSLETRLSQKLSKAVGRKVSVASKTFHSFGLSTLVQARGEGVRPRVLKEGAGE